VNNKNTHNTGELELDFNEIEVKKAQVPILPDADNSPESTHPLTEAPFPSGASLSSNTILDPVLSKVNDVPVDEELVRFLPPPFFLRLNLDPTLEGRSKVEKIADQTWSITNGQLWPVFIKRFHLTKPIKASTLKRLAIAAKRYADNRLCLGPNGYFDVFFNDRKSLEQFTQDIEGELPSSHAQAHVKISYCSGLFCCPMAAKDTLSAARKLSETLNSHIWAKTSKRRSPLTLTIAGCQVGQGLGCGLREYSDLALIGRRDSLPEIDQKIASLSPKISFLITGCPGQAINRSHIPGSIIDINQGRCNRCGWCVNEDPAFSWPSPQKGYFSLEISGRRTFSPYEFVPSSMLWEKIPEDYIDFSIILLKLIECWRSIAYDGEILADFTTRKGIINIENIN
jgi:dissimilatory sulfite reductase (desulfoviridin) alpha/beta subunit